MNKFKVGDRVITKSPYRYRKGTVVRLIQLPEHYEHNNRMGIVNLLEIKWTEYDYKNTWTNIEDVQLVIEPWEIWKKLNA